MLNLEIFFIRNAKGVPSLSNLKRQQYSYFYIQTLYKDCSHIEDAHLLFYAHFMNIFFIFFFFLGGGDLELTHFFR